MSKNKPFKLYTDGSYYESNQDKICAIGGYCIDNKNIQIFDFTNQLEDENYFKYHEMVALKYGLEQCIKNNIKHLICHFDDVGLRSYFKGDGIICDDLSKKSELIKQIYLLKSSFDYIEFIHIKRKFNKKADLLAGKFKKNHIHNMTNYALPGKLNHKKLFNLNNLITDELIINSENFKEILQNSIGTIIFDFENQKEDKILIQSSFTDNSKVNTIINSQIMPNKQINTMGLEAFCSSLEFLLNSYGKQKTVLLQINSPNSYIDRFEMLLKKRYPLPQPDTFLTRKLNSFSSQFENIILLPNTKT